MSSNYTQDNLGLTVVSPLDPDLLLRSMHGEDRISGLFHYHLELYSQKSDLDMTAMVGESVTAKIAYPDGEYCINGIVARFVQAGTSLRFTTYYAELRPWLWMLSMSVDSQIFQEKSVTDIIKQVFDDAGFSDYKISTQGTYNPREYCVQYQESAFDFVSRLMEDEGIFYFFEHEEGKHTMVIADDPSAHKAREGATAAKVAVQENASEFDALVTHISLEQQVTVGAYAMTDYDFEKPTGDLKVSVTGEEAKREVFEYPGGYIVKGDGEGYAKVRIESHELPAKLVRGQSGVRHFLSGYKISVEEHVRSDINGDYVLSYVSHQANTTRYQNTFEGFPSDVPFRPQQLTRKPVIVGAQTAVVVGKSGEEIFTDEYGRIKVKFHWDRKGKSDETASCFIRVAHGWAGKGWGAFYLPRIGQEVIVSFLEGDPDRPIVTGSVYNAEQTVPYALPDNATKSTLKSESSKGGGGNNEFRFEDKKDEEEIYMHAQKDYNVKVENDATWEILNDETVTIKNQRKVTIEEADDLLTVSKGNQTIEVSKGNQETKVKGTRKVDVTDNEDHVNAADFTHEVKGNYTLKVTGNLKIEATGKIDIVSTGAMKIESKQAMDVKAGMDLKAKAGMNMKLEGGINLEAKGGVGFKAKGGAMAEVQGGGMLTLKGGLVKIN